MALSRNRNDVDGKDDDDGNRKKAVLLLILALVWREFFQPICDILALAMEIFIL
jgi:hypothetical protein